MAQEILNSNENINIPHTISFWFQKDFTGEYLELGDILDVAVTLGLEFFDFRSYRNGLNAIRKRLLTAKNASVTMTLNEPNAMNLQRATYGGTITTNQSQDALEGRHLDVASDATGEFVDLSDAGEDDFGNISVTGIYLTTDVTHGTNLLSADIALDTDGKAYFDATDVGAGVGSTVYVTYTHTVSGMYGSEIFGAAETSIEGAAKLQARNPQGGVIQIWDFSSVQLAPNGDLPFPLDTIQTIPLVATLQERSGTFGTIYSK